MTPVPGVTACNTKTAAGKWRVEHAGTNKQAAVRLLARRKREAAKGVQVTRDASPRTHLDTYAEALERASKANRKAKRRSRVRELPAPCVAADRLHGSGRDQAARCLGAQRDADCAR